MSRVRIINPEKKLDVENSYAQKTVTTTRSKIADRDAQRIKLSVRFVSGTSPVYIGSKNVSATDCMPLLTNEALEWNGDEAQPELWAVASAGTTVLCIVECNLKEF